MTARELFTVLLRLAGIVFLLGAATDGVTYFAIRDDFPYPWMWLHPALRGAAGAVLLFLAGPMANAFHRGEAPVTSSTVTNVDLQRFGLLLLAGYSLIVALRPLGSMITKVLSPRDIEMGLWRTVREDAVHVAVYVAAATLLLVRRRHLAALVQRLRYEPKAVGRGGSDAGA